MRRSVLIKKNQWVGEYIGELRPHKRVQNELKNLGKQTMYRFDIHTELASGRMGPIIVLDSELEGNWTRFINSRCKGSNLTVT